MITIDDLFESLSDEIFSPEYDDLSTIVWDACIIPLQENDDDRGTEIEDTIVSLLISERKHAFKIGFQTAISLIFEGRQINV